MKNPDTKQSQNQATATKRSKETKQQNNKELLSPIVWDGNIIPQ